MATLNLTQVAVMLPFYHEVMAYYREPQRVYHDVTHIHTLLRVGTEVCAEMRLESDARLMVQLATAILFHDAYYDPYAQKGYPESASASLAVATLRRYQAKGLLRVARDFDLPATINSIQATAFYTDKDKQAAIMNEVEDEQSRLIGLLMLDLDLHSLQYEPSHDVSKGIDRKLCKEYENYSSRPMDGSYSAKRAEFILRMHLRAEHPTGFFHLPYKGAHKFFDSHETRDVLQAQVSDVVHTPNNGIKATVFVGGSYIPVTIKL